jgi:cell division septation protein DedD
LENMTTHKIVAGVLIAALLASGCSRQQSDWQKTRETNTADAYEQFLKKYPGGEFAPQAQARVKELYEERDWQKARDADTPEAYQAFLKQYPEGKWTEEARIRVENFTLAQAPGPGQPGVGQPGISTAGAATPGAASGQSAVAAPPSTMTESGAASTTGSPPSEPSEAPPSVAAVPSGISHSTSAAGGAAKSGGAYRVQLGAFKSGADAANQRWAHLRKAYPTVFAGMTSKVVPLKTADGNLYRLQTTGLSEKQARKVCSALKAKSEACIVVPPAHG